MSAFRANALLMLLLTTGCVSIATLPPTWAPAYGDCNSIPGIYKDDGEYPEDKYTYRPSFATVLSLGPKLKDRKMKAEKLSIEFATDQSLVFTSIGAAGMIAEQSYPPGSYTCTGPVLKLDQNSGLRTDGGLAVEGVALELHRTGRHVVVKMSSSAAGIVVAPAGMIVLPIPVVGYITSYTRFEVEGR